MTRPRNLGDMARRLADRAMLDRLDAMKGGARHPRALPAVPMFDDVPAPGPVAPPAPGPVAPPAPQLDLLRATQEEMPLDEQLCTHDDCRAPGHPHGCTPFWRGAQP